MTINRQIIFVKRPNGVPTLADFNLKEVALNQPAEGEVLVKTLYFSLDPYMRGRMNEGASYILPMDIGEVMGGEAVCEVVASKAPNFKIGDKVLAFSGWQEYALLPANALTFINPHTKPSYALGMLGMPGFTAYVGLLDIGAPKQGETVVVAAATGAVGSLVGQIAKIKGCRVIGIAGNQEKCSYAVAELGFDICIDHHHPHLQDLIQDACPDGIDIYFENVGGKVLEAILPLLNNNARIPVCGIIAYYNLNELPKGPDKMPLLLKHILAKRLKVQGFINSDYRAQYEKAFFTDMTNWLSAGKLKYREDIVAGIENAPHAFIGLLQGHNFGKLLVKP